MGDSCEYRLGRFRASHTSQVDNNPAGQADDAESFEDAWKWHYSVGPKKVGAIEDPEIEMRVSAMLGEENCQEGGVASFSKGNEMLTSGIARGSCISQP